MAENWVSYTVGSQSTGIVKLSVNEATVSAQSTPLGTTLSFPASWQWNEDWKQKNIRWEIVQGNGTLFWAGGTKLIFLGWFVPFYIVEGRMPQLIDCRLGLTQVEEMETLRNGSGAKFLMRIITIMAKTTETPLSRLTELPAIQSDLILNIPRSTFEDNILPNVGINGLTSLTITFPQGTQKIFAAPLFELQRAEKTLRTASTEEQFESVVLQCRNVVDSLLNQFTFQLPNRVDGRPDASFRTRADALASQELKKVISESQAEAVSHILKDLWEPYSAASKPGLAHHTRAFATFALHQAASIVKLTSEVLWQQNQI